MKETSVVHSDPNILGGTPVFVGTRVPVQALIDYIEGGHSLNAFLDDFPTVTRDMRVPVQALIDYIEGGHSLNAFLDDFPTVTRDMAIAALEQAKAHLIADASAA